MKIIDANIVLRYLLKDDKKLFAKAVEIIENGDVFITNEIIAEIVYVLEKVYIVPKLEISEVLTSFFSSAIIILADKELIIQALNYYEKHNLDFVDSVLLAYNKINKYEIITFDKKLTKLLK
ncbi:MAG: PIN domain-containing protein [Ignavibacteriae bacterium]|nr:PIN domain-containing protein [Ignavibacteriota bacterium]MCB9211153.1 PIN domain-containing protein [Ignavibacteriales bacterium]